MIVKFAAEDRSDGDGDGRVGKVEQERSCGAYQEECAGVGGLTGGEGRDPCPANPAINSSNCPHFNRSFPHTPIFIHILFSGFLCFLLHHCYIGSRDRLSMLSAEIRQAALHRAKPVPQRVGSPRGLITAFISDIEQFHGIDFPAGMNTAFLPLQLQPP
ncbi:hypothetical protein J6590_011390 [Homalodisca vitripennis]|nr:hypothetical protein J6590_011390 [Homalodisca vitripennis]